MTRAEANAAENQLSMPDSQFRDYLEAFLGCAFQDPADYLEEAPGPQLNISDEQSPSARALGKALSKADDSSCWTVEVRLSLRPGELALEGSDELDHLVVFGAEHEPTYTRIESWLDAEDGLDSPRSTFVPDACARTSEDGLTRSLIVADERQLQARQWTADRIKKAVTE